MASHAIVVVVFAICLATSEAGNTLHCPSCEHALRREDCTVMERCHHNDVCQADVARFGDGTIRYRFGCAPPSECNHLLGKRRSQLSLLCAACCDTEGCHRSLCNRDFGHHLISTPVTTSTIAPTHVIPTAINRHCKACNKIRDPEKCHNAVTCNNDQVCFTEVFKVDGENWYRLYCGSQKTCVNAHRLNILGKRSANTVSRTDNTLTYSENTELRGDNAVADSRGNDTVSRRAVHVRVCSECCYDHSGCNKHLCGGLAPSKPHNGSVTAISTATSTATPTSRPTSTTSTTTSPTSTIGATHLTPVVGPNCHDKEEDGITCATLDLFRMCSDPAPFAYFMAHDKCPKHCGFCTSTLHTQPVHVTPPPNGVCENYEQDGYTCASLDAMFSVCTGSSTMEYVIAHTKCPKYCGFCQPAGGMAHQSTTTHPTSTQPTSTQTKATQTTATQTTTILYTATKHRATQQTTQAATSTTQASAGVTCMDFEDASFSCAVWVTRGYCVPVPGSGYETAKLRCRKSCGFC